VLVITSPSAESGPAATQTVATHPGGRIRARNRILIIVENLPCPFDRRVWQEARALRAAGYTVSIICPKGPGYMRSYEELDGIQIYRHPQPFEASTALGYLGEYTWALLAQFALSVRIALFGRGFDVIHACNPPDTIFLIGAFYKLFGKKFVFDHHDINPELYLAKFGRRDLLYKMLLLLERWTFKTADVCIATNESYKRIAVERGGVPASRVFVVRSGPDLSRMRILPPDSALKRGRNYLVGYVGVMGRQEGIDGLLTAIHHIVHELGRRDVHFGLVGGGTALEEAKARARALHVEDYVTFTGRVPDEAMLAMLNTADVCVNPDVANEMNDKSTMNKIMEYMALGKPIVQYDLTEGRVSAQDASLYAARNDPIDLARKLLTLIDDEPLRRRMGELGLERVRTRLAWEHEVPNLLAAYEVVQATSTEKLARG
jgi:glycosyltransferase involved in cell wall biosynthesis